MPYEASVVFWNLMTTVSPMTLIEPSSGQQGIAFTSCICASYCVFSSLA